VPASSSQLTSEGGPQGPANNAGDKDQTSASAMDTDDGGGGGRRRGSGGEGSVGGGLEGKRAGEGKSGKESGDGAEPVGGGEEVCCYGVAMVLLRCC